MADAREEGFELIPIDDEEIPPEDDLNAATAAALNDPESPPEVDPGGPEPFGVTSAFDWDAGRYKRHGQQPVRVSGLDALREWCMMALNSTRFAHEVFSARFGMDDPREGLGRGLDDEDDLPSDYEQKIREALIVHDRVADVRDFDIVWDPLEGILRIRRFTVVTDEADTLPFADIQLVAEEAS